MKKLNLEDFDDDTPAHDPAVTRPPPYPGPGTTVTVTRIGGYDPKLGRPDGPEHPNFDPTLEVGVVKAPRKRYESDRRQFRRTVSLNKDCYARLKAYCEANNLACSEFVESLLRDLPPVEKKPHA